MKKFTLSIALVAIIGLQAYSQDLKPISAFPINAGKTVSTPSKNHPIQLLARGGAPAITVAYSDDFNALNDTDNLKLRGYIPYYRGAGPQGTTATWYQGAGATAGTFDAYNGAATDYVAANYNVVTGANNIDSWLVLPALNINTGDIMTFYSQSIVGSIYPDSIRVMYSAVGDSVPEDLSWVELGNFVVNTIGIWELQSFTAPAAGVTARFAIRYNVVDGGPTGSNSNYIGIDQLDVFTPSAVDGGVSVIDPIASGCGLSATTPITVTISNFGMGAISGFPVSYTINAGTPVTETFTGSIAPAATASYTFTATADLSLPGTYTIDASTAIPSDGNATNDGVSISTINSAPADLTLGPVTMGFEPADDLTGWLFEDANVDGFLWALAYNPNFTVAAHTGDYCLRVGAGVDINDWLYTRCITLTAGVNYNLDYWTYLFDLASPGDIDVWVGNAQNVAAMTQQIVTTSSMDAQWIETNQIFSVATSGTYYLGFHASSATTAIIRIDDINISMVTGVQENSLSNAVSIYPNPATDVINISGKLREDVKIEITNAIGQVVYTSDFKNLSGTQIDVSKFANGIYTVQVMTSKETVTKKITVDNK